MPSSPASARNDGRDDSGVCFHSMSLWRNSVARDSWAGFRPLLGLEPLCKIFTSLRLWPPSGRAVSPILQCAFIVDTGERSKFTRERLLRYLPFLDSITCGLLQSLPVDAQMSAGCQPGSLCTQNKEPRPIRSPEILPNRSGTAHHRFVHSESSRSVLPSRATRMTTLRFTRSARAMAVFVQPRAKRSRMIASSSADTWLLARRT